MPLPINIAHLLSGRSVEWERLEFKAGWNPLDVLHTLCAFANDFHNLGGGYLILGVAEEGGRPVLPPVGLDLATVDAIQKQVLNLGHSAIQPQYHPIVVPYEVAGRQVLVLWAPGGQSRPYRARLSLAKDRRPTAVLTPKSVGRRGKGGVSGIATDIGRWVCGFYSSYTPMNPSLLLPWRIEEALTSLNSTERPRHRPVCGLRRSDALILSP